MALCAPSRLRNAHRRGRIIIRHPNLSRRSSGVERAIGNGEADSSILSGGTIYPHYRNSQLTKTLDAAGSARENFSMNTQNTLIGPNDPPPFEVLNPDGAASMLLVCDHASRAIPKSLDTLGLDQKQLDLHIAWDIGAADVTRQLSERLDAAAVLAGYSRLLIDVNRQDGDPGSIPLVSDTIPIPGNQDLNEDEQRQRVESFFRPYHTAAADALAHLWRRGPAPGLFSIHTFTPSLGGEDRYWDIGVLWNRDPRMPTPLMEKLRMAEDGTLHVGDNEPYSGREIAYTIDLHAGAAGLPNCAVEIRQDLVETPEGVERWADILAEAFADILADDTLHRVEHF